MFREDFVWGVASSAYQVEGTDAADGRGACVWDMFAADGRVFEHQNADTSCDHMHHYKEDIALMKHLGIRAYRFSLNWARILPEGTGRVNEKAIAMYRDMILTMKENGITPYLTLFHWEFRRRFMSGAAGRTRTWCSGLENMQKWLPRISATSANILLRSTSRSVWSVSDI